MCYKLLPFVFIIAIVFYGNVQLNAQYENVWAFGDGAGIDFNTNPPQSIKTSIYTHEGSASICDVNGQLLFYTDGNSVWDRNNKLMPNGTDLPGVGSNITSSTTQGTLIVQMPGDTNKYYIFSLGKYEDAFYLGRLYYSIIDMSLNNGAGDVIPGHKGILLDSMLTEHMTAVSGNNCNIWLLVVSRSSNTFKAYNIDFNGIALNPVTSSRIAGGGQYDGILGSIDVAPNGNKLAIAQGNLVLYDFDPDLGEITNPLILDKSILHYYYGVSFSPNSTKLYASSDDPIYQFDMTSNDSNSIIGSKILIARSLFPAIKRGPDGKIYIANADSNSINIISHPNIAGTACQYVNNGFPLFVGTRSELGLPNSVTIITSRRIYHSAVDTAFCTNNFLLTAKDTSGANYVWEDGSAGPIHRADKPGIYWVSYQVNSPCMIYECVDSFNVTFDFSKKNICTITLDSGVCKADTILVKAGNLTGSNYIWDDGSTGKLRKVNQAGIYWVSYETDSLCEHHTDSFIITYPEKDYKVSFIADTLVCANDLIQFQNTSDSHFNHFIWSFGNQNSSLLENPQYTYAQSGNYAVRLVGKMDSICPDTAYKTIIVDSMLFSAFTIAPDSICAGEAITFTHQMLSNSINSLHWQFGDGTAMFSKDNKIHHAYDIAGIMPVNLKALFRACPDTSFTDTVYVYALPKVDLGADTGLCLHGEPIILKNLQVPPNGIYHNLWNTGDTTEKLKVVHPGTYSLTIKTEPLGCSNTESIKITKDCYIDIPNAFTPNGDGENDYFFPRQLLSQKLTQFKMQIFNRWGQLIFETQKTSGRGWDGKFNGKLQPESAYVYLIDAEIDGNRTEYYQGNVTLIR